VSKTRLSEINLVALYLSLKFNKGGYMRQYNLENGMIERGEEPYPKVIFHCDVCNEAIYANEEYLEWNDYIMHEDCQFDFFMDKLAKEFTRKIAGDN
jgi:hypothetical protein